MAAVLPSRQFVRFLVVGVLNTAVGYGLFAFFVILGLHYGIAAALSTVLGVLFNFHTIGRLVFESRDRSLLLRFAAVYATTYVLNVGALRALEATRQPVLVVQAGLAFPMAAVAFALHRRFVFHREKVTP
jgi:putative flippase GtrA